MNSSIVEGGSAIPVLHVHVDIVADALFEVLPQKCVEVFGYRRSSFAFLPRPVTYEREERMLPLTIVQIQIYTSRDEAFEIK